MNNTFIYGVELDDLASQEIYYALRDNPGGVNLEKNIQLGLFTRTSRKAPSFRAGISGFQTFRFAIK